MAENNKTKTFFITTAIPYVNASPHIGFALEIVQADVIARFHRIRGEDVFFLTGTDENALKNVLSAKETGVDTQVFVDKYAAEFKRLKDALNISWDDFIRTTEDRHVRGAQKLWLACRKEDIYKKKYRGLYCVGCEEFKTEKELVEGRCPEHSQKALEEVEEENYFFRLSNYQKELEDLIGSGALEVIPETRRNEVLSFVRQGLNDFSISRSRARAQGWGIPVPGDDMQMMYVWFDALINYITALGYADDALKFQKYWQENEHILHIIGKGVSRFHAIYWPAMLLSAGLRLPRQIFAHGYITIEGKKISKSLGNVIDPFALVEKYSADPVRYYLLRDIPTSEDGDFSVKKLEERYNGDLANGLGNLVARVAKVGERASPITFVFDRDIENAVKDEVKRVFFEYLDLARDIRLNEALSRVWELIGFTDRYVNTCAPWTVKDAAELKRIIANAAYLVGAIANLLGPFLPETSEEIKNRIQFKDSVLTIQRGENLFPRLN